MAVTMKETMQVIRKYAPDFNAKTGIILGSGLSAIAEQLTNKVTIPYQAIPGLQTGSVSGHASLLELGLLNGEPVICLKGRIHLYEGASYDAVKTLVRIVKLLGAQNIIITGAVGSLNEEVGPGELINVIDHINFHPGNPLVGPNDESMGPRFIAMERAYDPFVSDTIVDVAARLNIPMTRGVYLSTLGPSFETPAEIRAFRILGADCVGMSVVPEVIVAHHCGLKVGAVAAVTNLAAGMSSAEISHEGTLQYGELGARKLVKIIPEVVKVLANAT